MIDTKEYTAKAKFSFEEDPLEQILMGVEESAHFNSLTADFSISGSYVGEEYFNVNSVIFKDIEDLRNGIATVVIETNLNPRRFYASKQYPMLHKLVSAFVKQNNSSFTLYDGDHQAEIVFTEFKLEGLK